VVADLFVTESAREAGVGTALMQRARAIAASRGAKQMAWTVYRLNAPARRFYRGVGGPDIEGINQMYMHV